MKHSVREAGLLAALCALSASSAPAQFTNIQQSPWQGGVNHFCGNTWISNSMTLNNSGSLVYNTSTLPATTGPLDGRSGDYWFGTGVLVDGGDGATINNNSDGTIQGIVTGTGEAMAAGVYSIQNFTVNNSGAVDGEVQNHDGWAVGVWADSGGANITNNAGATISATAAWQAQGIQVGQKVNVVNNGTITATATGGTQGTTANNALVNGINVFSYTTDGSCPIYMENNGTLAANCTGGTSVTNSGRAVGLWAEGSSVAFRNTGLVTTGMTPGSQGEVDCSYIGADNADVSFFNSGTFSQTNNGVCVWLEQDSDVGDMRIDNSGIIASSQTWAIELGQYNDGNTSGHCYVTNTGSISGGWMGLAWNESGGFTFYDSGDVHVGLNWLGGNADVHVFGLPTWDAAINNYGSGGSNLVFNLIGTLQKVNGNAASGTNLSVFNLGSSGSIMVSGKTYGWNAFTTVTGCVRLTGSVPPPWQQQDVGTVGVAGGAVYEGTMFALLASGNDIGGTADAFHYVYQPVSNNCTLIARVSAEQTASANAKGGVMIRDSLNANAANAFIGVMPGNRVVFQYRSSDGGGSSSNSVTGLSASYWVKLAQSGNTLTGYYSVDGVMWTQLGLATNSMGSTNYAGLAYCNNGNSSSGTVTFYSVACTGQLFVPSAPTGLTALAGVEQVTLTWQAASNAASYDIGRSTVSGGSYTTVGSTSGTNYTDVNLVGRTTYYYVVTAVSPGSQGTNSDQVSATPAANVPPPWVAQDIGPVAVAGSESCTSNLFTVTASGNDIASAADAFRFVYETNSGNCTIVVRVASLQSIDGWSLAGVMIRGSLNANAANVFIGLTPSNGVVFEHRSADGTLEGVDNNVASPVAPCWVALVQSGSTFTGYYSVDGVNWNQLGTTMVSMGVTKYVGMAVCSRKGLSLCTATFDNVSAPGWPSLAGPTGVTATATSSGQVNLTWNALTNATSYIVKRSTVSGGPYSIIARGLIATNFTDNVVAVGIKYYYVVSAIIGDLESSGSPEATVNLPLLSPWVSQDIGGAVSQSSAIYNNGVFSVTGAGADIQGTADAFRFAYVPVTGNCTIIARVSGVQNIDPWSKAGVMIRDSVAANGANAFIGVTPGNGVTWQYRSTDGGGTIYNNTGSLTAPCWLKLVRSGNTFTGYYSPDGVTWTQQGTATCTIGTSALVGLAVTSHNSSSVCTATFDNVTVPGWPLLPRVPGSLTATAGNAQVTLSWPAVSGASSYNLKSATNSGGSYVVLTNMTTTAYTNTGLLNGTTYFYVVSALNIAGESTNSVPASATPQAPPTLVISQTGANFMISWPLASAGFTLQSCTNLAAANWVNVTSPAPQIVGSQWQVVLPPPGAGSSAYYRLSK